MTIESRADFARRMGVDRSAVTRWAEGGKIVCTEMGDVDVEASATRLQQAAGSAHGGHNRGAGAARAAAGLPGPPGTPATPQKSGTGTLLDARTRLAQSQAARVETEQAVRAGTLVERARYAKALEDSHGPVFAAMSQFSALHGADLAAETDPRRMQVALDDLMDGLRREVAAAIRKLIDGPLK